MIHKKILTRKSRLPDRDVNILKLCHEQKYVTLNQIAKAYFPKSSNKYKVPLRCVNRLMKRNLLRNLKQRIGRATLYLVGQKGINILKDKNLNSLSYIKTVDWHSHDEDLWATDLRLILENLGFKWTPGRLLKGTNTRKHTSNGKAELRGHTFVVEIERNPKKDKSYQWVFRKRSKNHPDGLILYIVKDERTKASRLKDSANYKRIYFVTIDELHILEAEALFVNSDDNELKLKDLIDLKKRKPFDKSFDLFRKADLKH